MIRHLTAADARRVAWKNGRGFTDELALWPEGAAFERGDYDWRIARAAVDEPGPFSAFPGFDRVLVVTSGAGLRLQHGRSAPRVRVLPLSPQRFSGDWSTSATLIDGPVTDLNILVRRGLVHAVVTLLRPGARSLHVLELPGPGHTFVHVISGAIDARVTGSGGSLLLAAGESLWVGGAPAARDGEAPVHDEPTVPQLELGGSRASGVALLVRLLADDSSG